MAGTCSGLNRDADDLLAEAFRLYSQDGLSGFVSGAQDCQCAAAVRIERAGGIVLRRNRIAAAEAKQEAPAQE